ncbi:MAG: hypothetical protein ACLFMX_04220 [Halobacteriales archaeon]
MLGPPPALLAAAIAATPSSAPHLQVPPEAFVPLVWGLAGVGSAAVTLVVGGLWIALAPGYVTRVTDGALERPGTAFVWGLALAVGILVGALLLALTVVGIVVAFPLLLAFGLFSFLTAELGFIAIGRAFAEGWGGVLVVAVAAAFLLAIVPFVGALASFVVGSVGMGAVVVDYWASE